MENSKKCRACKEEINKEASWCPKCSRPQSTLRAIFPPQAITLLVIGLVGYWYLTYSAMEDSFDKLSTNAIYEVSEILEVSDTSIQIKKEGCETCITTLGKIKNSSTQAYGNIHFQVTYYNSNNSPVDVVNDKNSDLVVGPNSEGAFRVKAKSAAEASEYSRVEVKITKAKPDVGWY